MRWASAVVCSACVVVWRWNHVHVSRPRAHVPREEEGSPEGQQDGAHSWRGPAANEKDRPNPKVDRTTKTDAPSVEWTKMHDESTAKGSNR